MYQVYDDKRKQLWSQNQLIKERLSQLEEFNQPMLSELGDDSQYLKKAEFVKRQDEDYKQLHKHLDERYKVIEKELKQKNVRESQVIPGKNDIIEKNKKIKSKKQMEAEKKQEEDRKLNEFIYNVNQKYADFLEPEEQNIQTELQLAEKRLYGKKYEVYCQQKKQEQVFQKVTQERLAKPKFDRQLTAKTWQKQQSYKATSDNLAPVSHLPPDPQLQQLQFEVDLQKETQTAKQKTLTLQQQIVNEFKQKNAIIQKYNKINMKIDAFSINQKLLNQLIDDHVWKKLDPDGSQICSIFELLEYVQKHIVILDTFDINSEKFVQLVKNYHFSRKGLISKKELKNIMMRKEVRKTPDEVIQLMDQIDSQDYSIILKLDETFLEDEDKDAIIREKDEIIEPDPALAQLYNLTHINHQYHLTHDPPNKPPVIVPTQKVVVLPPKKRELDPAFVAFDRQMGQLKVQVKEKKM